MRVKSDFIFLGIIALLICNATFYAFFVGFILSINTYIGVAFWIIVLFLKVTKPRIGRYAVAILLIGGTLNILNFGLGKAGFSVGVAGFETPGIDPIIFLILIAYWIVNRKAINRVVSNALITMFHGNLDERELKEQNKVDFYYRKFSICDDLEFSGIVANLKEYPDEAQMALKLISNERKINKLADKA